MCKFFSFISDGSGKFYYFNDDQRKLILKNELKSNGWIVTEPDSHSSIARFYFKNGTEDSMNKYEFNPITRSFIIDQINTKDDSALAKDFVMNLDFRTIAAELNIVKIENPLEAEGVYVDNYHILLLQKWSSVRASVGDSVRASVGDSVWGSVWCSVRDSVRASVGDSVMNSVRDSVRASVGDSVRASVGDSVGGSVWFSVGDSVWFSVMDSAVASVRDSAVASVRDSVWALVSSFFIIENNNWKYCDGINFEGCENPFQSCIDLWSLGLVPSFDGKKWRLYAGKDAKIVFEISKEDLEKYEVEL